MTNLDSILKRRDITLPTKAHLVKAMLFPTEKKCEKAKWLSGDVLQKLWKEEKRKAKEKRKDINI